MNTSFSCAIKVHEGCGYSPRNCVCPCHGFFPKEIDMTDFPDRNLFFLRRLVDSGAPDRLDGTPHFLTRGDVPQLPVGTLLEDHVPESAQRWLWVRMADNQVGEGLICLYAETDGEPTPDGVGTKLPADRHTSLRIVGSLPGTPASLVGMP